MAFFESSDIPRVDHIPPRGSKGYPTGAMLFRRIFPTGIYVNNGTHDLCQFVPVTRDPLEYRIIDGGKFTLTDNDTTVGPTAANNGLRCNTAAVSIATYGVGTGTDQLQQWKVSAADTITAKYTDPGTGQVVNWLVAQKGGLARYDIVFAGIHTTVGGQATEAITLAGAAASDLCFVQTHTKGGTPRLIVGSAMTANTLTITFADDPNTGTATKVNYMVLREHGVSQPTHYIHKTALYPCVTADGATMSVTDSAALTTDVVFTMVDTTDDTDYVVSTRVATAGTVTIEASADPAADNTHQFQYFLIRELSA